MSYVKSMYGSRSPDFIEGFLAAMDTYSVWLNGERFIGSPERKLWDQMKEDIIDLGGKPEDYLDLEPENEQITQADPDKTGAA